MPYYDTGRHATTRFPSARPLARLRARRNSRDVASAREHCGGRRFLKAGGTAADAAVAAVATLCVVEPAMTGIGGDCFCLVAKPNAPVWGYNGSGRAASAATTERMLAAGLPRQIPATSPHAVTVPGAIDAWEAILGAHGRFGLDRVLQHAIRHAEDGFPIAPRVAADWANLVDKLARHAGSVKHFLVNGNRPRSDM